MILNLYGKPLQRQRKFPFCFARNLDIPVQCIRTNSSLFPVIPKSLIIEKKKDKEHSHNFFQNIRIATIIIPN